MRFIRRLPRVGIFFDVSNICCSAWDLYKGKPDFKKIFKKALENRKLITAIAYTPGEETDESIRFRDALKYTGFKVRTKPWKVYENNKKGNMDVEIAVDIMKSYERLDVIVLITGDGDFTYLVKEMRNERKKVEVLSFHRTTASELLEACSYSFCLTDEYLLKEGDN